MSQTGGLCRRSAAAPPLTAPPRALLPAPHRTPSSPCTQLRDGIRRLWRGRGAVAGHPGGDCAARRRRQLPGGTWVGRSADVGAGTARASCLRLHVRVVRTRLQIPISHPGCCRCMPRALGRLLRSLTAPNGELSFFSPFFSFIALHSRGPASPPACGPSSCPPAHADASCAPPPPPACPALDRRAHLNTTEVVGQALALQCLLGLAYPTAAAALGATWAVGRIVYTLGALPCRCAAAAPALPLPHPCPALACLNAWPAWLSKQASSPPTALGHPCHAWSAAPQATAPGTQASAGRAAPCRGSPSLLSSWPRW